MNLTDTFYVALCMTILILGVVYWFWTQNQYMQRKLNLLENIVFEIKTQIQKGGDSPPGLVSPTMVIGSGAESGSKYPPAPSSELGEDEDLLNEELHEELEFEEAPVANSPTLKISEDATTAPATSGAIPDVNDLADVADDSDLVAALQPGGVGSGIQEVHAPEADNSAKGSVLEGMTLKELQRLAEQKGINTNRMRKPQLIEAIRAHSRPSPFQTTETTLELS
jgi:hypothetical protein